MSNILPKITVAQLGARMHYAVPMILQRSGMLSSFCTDFFVGNNSLLHYLINISNLLPNNFQPASLKRLMARREDRILSENVSSFNMFGLQYYLALRRCRTPEEIEKTHLTYGKRFCVLVLKDKLCNADGVYAFQSAALPIFYSAHEFGMVNILEKTGAPKRIEYFLFSEEHLRWPGWELAYPDLEIWQPRIDLENEECQVADTIICGSTFVAQGLKSVGVHPEKIRVVPYGLDLVRYEVKRQPWDGRRPLRILFVGNVTIHKGPQYLFQALELLNNPRILTRIVGPLSIREPYRKLLQKHVTLVGQVSRSEVHEQYKWADIFIFPTICEGSATVTYEALTAGLPVITTPNSGSVVRDGADGFIVPIRDAEAIAEKIELFLKSPDLLNTMSENARKRAQEFSLEKYGERLVKELIEVIPGKSIAY